MNRMEGKQTWIYCRVAYPDACALAVQQKRLEAYAEEHDLVVAGITAEHASGLDNSRKGLREVFHAVETGMVDLLLVTDLSRLSRDFVATDTYLRWLEDRYVEVICADGTVPQTQTEILLGLVAASKLQGTEG